MAPTLSPPPIGSAQLLGVRALSKLKWRCRRGLLENDLFISRFFGRYESTLTVGQADAMSALMDLSDPDLLDLLLCKREPDAALARAPVIELLRMLRT